MTTTTTSTTCAGRTRSDEDRARSRPRARHADVPLLSAAETAFLDLGSGPTPLTLDGRRYSGLPERDVPVTELRTLLRSGSCDRTTEDEVWAELVRRSRSEGGAWTLACVGMAIPALLGVTKKLCAAFAGDPADVHAEILGGFLTSLTTVDLTKKSVLNRLRWQAYRAGYAAVRDALDAPTPYSLGFDSAPPPPVAGHPDFVLARAVTDGALTETDADVIGTTRLEDVSLQEWAATQGVSYAAARQLRSRAERRLVAWLSEHDTYADITEGTRRSPSTVGQSPAGLSHIDPKNGVKGRSGTLPAASHADRSYARPEEQRCA